MSNLDELYQELNRLPKGTLVSKKTKGVPRYYLQWREHYRLVSKYVSLSKKEELQRQILRRQSIERQIRKLEKQLPKALTALSHEAKVLSGSLMEKDNKVAIFNHGQCLWLDEKRAPLYIKRTKNLFNFLAGRVIDPERRNSRILKKVLSLSGEDDTLLALHVYGASITDDYWFKPRGSKKSYRDVAFQSDLYADTALNGNINLVPRHHSPTPQLVLGGSYEKCWKLIDGEWWIIKNGNPNELFSEYFVFLLGQAFGFNMAEYLIDGKTIRSRNFALRFNYEPAKSLLDGNDDYRVCFETISAFGSSLAEDYLKIIWMDSLVNNVDRHTENFGFLRNPKNGEVVGMAPNFDNNAALIARGYPMDLERKQDGLIGFFAEFLRKDPKAKALYQAMALPKLDRPLLDSLFKKSPIKVNEGAIASYLLRGYQILKDLQK
jgi:hypothetical protein